LYGKILDKKENEISAIPEAIECLDIAGGIVTIDAMGCQGFSEKRYAFSRMVPQGLC
jgi:predicted transposase YbfD/YdcC